MSEKTIPNKRRVLYVGQAYYNCWYLSRELRKLGWKADVLDFNANAENDIYYHDRDFKFKFQSKSDRIRNLEFYFDSLVEYDIFHFSNARRLYFIWEFDSKRQGNGSTGSKVFKKLATLLLGGALNWNPRRIRRMAILIGIGNVRRILRLFKGFLPERWDVKLLRKCNKKIVYSNNGCNDGVSQSSFRSWEAEQPACDICKWRDLPWACSDERNLAWGKLRNSLTDYQVTIGANRKDYNDSPLVHEVPEFYCLDPAVWNPNLLIPTNYKLNVPEDVVKIYHAVGHYELRTNSENNKNIKCTHIYVPLIERLKKEGHKVELIFFQDVENKKLRYYQMQADIVVDMLTFGFFGATVREALMLGKPVICYLRPEWLETMRKDVPEYVDRLPVVSATPGTVYDVLKDLVMNPQKREEIGKRSREFALRWHSSENAAKSFDRIYAGLLTQGLERVNVKSRLDAYRTASLFKSAEDVDSAEEWFKWVVKDSIKDALSAGAFFHLGEIENIRSNPDRSREYFSECIRIRPDHAKARSYLQEIAW